MKGPFLVVLRNMLGFEFETKAWGQSPEEAISDAMNQYNRNRSFREQKSQDHDVAIIDISRRALCIFQAELHL